MMEEPRPALAALQALDVEFKNVPERLRAAAKIIGLKEEEEEKDKDKDKKKSSAQGNNLRLGSIRLQWYNPGRGRARAEWVFRWLVTKVAKGDEAPAFRASCFSWALMSTLVDAIPLINAAEILAQGTIVESITKALNEFLNSEAGKEYLDNHISAFVTKLLDMIHPTDSPCGDKISREHLEAALRVKDSLAAETLACWIRLCRKKLAKGHGYSLMNLSPYSEIWSNRAISKLDSTGSSIKVFAENCLVPSILLYDSLLDAHHKLPTLEDQVKHLLLRHIIGPSKAAYFSAKQQKTIAERFWTDTLDMSIAPLKDVMAYCQKLGSQEQLDLFRKFIPQFFELAICNTQRANLKLRVQEGYWLEAVFSSLAKAVDIHLTYEASADLWAHRGKDGAEILSSLLKAAHDEQVKISTNTLRTIATRIAGISISTGGGLGTAIIEWNLVHHIIRLDPSIFILPDTAKSMVHGEYELRDRLFHLFSTAGNETASELLIDLIQGFAKFHRGLEFINLWFDEIVKGNSAALGLWISDRVIHQAAAPIWRSIFVEPELISLVDRYEKLLGPFSQTLIASIDHHSNVTILEAWPQVWASIVILDSMLCSATIRQLATFEQFSTSLWTSISTILEVGKLHAPFAARLWSMLTKLQLHLSETQSPFSSFMQKHCKNCLNSSLVLDAQVVLSDIKSLSGDAAKTSQFCSMITFLLTVQEHARLYEDLQVLSDSTLNIARDAAIFVYQQINDQILWDENTHWSIFANYSLLFFQFPTTLEHMSESSRDMLFTKLLFQKLVESKSNEYKTLINSIQNSLLFGQSNRMCLLKWTMALLGTLQHRYPGESSARVAFFLHRIPMKTFSASERKDIANRCLQVLIVPDYGPSSYGPPEPAAFSFLVNTIITCSPRVLLTHPDVIINLSRVETNDCKSDDVITQCMCKLIRSIFDCLEDEPAKDIQANILRLCDSALADIIKKHSKTLLMNNVVEQQFYALPLMVYRLLYFSKHDICVGEDLELLSECDKLLTSLYVEGSCSVLDLLSDDIKEYMQKRSNHNHPKFVRFAVQYPANDEDSESYFTVGRICLSTKDFNSYAIIQDIWRQRNSTPSVNSQKLTLEVVTGRILPNPPNPANLLGLHLFISSIEESQARPAEDLSKLKSILPSLANKIQSTANKQEIGYLLSNMMTILRHKRFMVSQYGVDGTLSAMIAILTSKNLVALSSVGPMLYVELCSIVRILLMQYRRQLGGRMHLILPVLQLLLTSLFTLHARSKPPSPLVPPSWLPRNSSSLDATHGRACSRVLTTWIHPSVSSVGTSGLIDETRKARQYAAEYVPYILMHFCSAQLVGQMVPRVREAIMPAIWACVAAVSREGLRGMNASMGKDERAIWFNMWPEYEKSQRKKPRGIETRDFDAA